jgi:taurine dioxygenase
MSFRLDIEPITPCIGAKLTGADLLSPTPAMINAIREALVEHQVLFFEDQPQLTATAQIEFAKAFGELHVHPAAPADNEHPELFVIHAHKESKVANGNGWHTDVSCDAKPPMATMLQMRQTPSNGGDTLFASMFAAYESLSTALQEFLQTLTARHESEHVYRGRYADRGAEDSNREYPSHSHPVVRTHPENGRLALYVNPSFTTRINELRADESQALLSYLYQHQQRVEFQTRFAWKANFIALWDNRSTQHFALWDYWPEERMGHRVTILGDAPYFDAAQAKPRTGLTKLARRL